MGIFSTIYDAGLSHRAKVVYMYLRDRANAQGQCYPSVRTIGRELGLSRSTVKRALAELVRSGRLTKEPRFRENGSNSSNLYSLR